MLHLHFFVDGFVPLVSFFLSFFLTVTVLLFFLTLFIKTNASLFLLSRMSNIKDLILDPNIFKMLFNQDYKSTMLAIFFYNVQFESHTPAAITTPCSCSLFFNNVILFWF